MPEPDMSGRIVTRGGHDLVTPLKRLPGRT